MGGVNYWDHPTGENNHIQLKNHKLPADDDQAKHDALNANHVYSNLIDLTKNIPIIHIKSEYLP